MAATETPLTLGIEEEYLLIDQTTRDLAEAPADLMQSCVEKLSGQVSPEFLQCQIEIGTRVCSTIAEAREDLRRLRATVADCAARHGLAPIAVSCHPFADWKDQHHTDKDRYNQLSRDLGSVVHRMLICGAHCHVGLPDGDTRIDVMRQMTYFLPHLLALSASSPFWQGRDTGLASYRLTVFDNLPRTGLPPEFHSFNAYSETVSTLTDLGVIEDASKIWWDMRPSAHFPTLEIRICDVSPRLEHMLSLAALIQCLTRLLLRLRRMNQRWRIYDRFLVNENRWRAQRYGVGDGLIDFGRRDIVPVAEIIDDLVDLLAEDAAALGCLSEIERLRDMARETSADRQRAVYRAAREKGTDHAEAMRQVVGHLMDEFHADL